MRLCCLSLVETIALLLQAWLGLEFVWVIVCILVPKQVMIYVIVSDVPMTNFESNRLLDKHNRGFR